jgi:hypothetical protein
MHLPITPPVLPMLAKRVDALPLGDGWIFEPKWDGCRTILFRDNDDVATASGLDFDALQLRLHHAVESGQRSLIGE